MLEETLKNLSLATSTSAFKFFFHDCSGEVTTARTWLIQQPQNWPHVAAVRTALNPVRLGNTASSQNRLVQYDLVNLIKLHCSNLISKHNPKIKNKKISRLESRVDRFPTQSDLLKPNLLARLLRLGYFSSMPWPFYTRRRLVVYR